MSVTYGEGAAAMLFPCQHRQKRLVVDLPDVWATTRALYPRTPYSVQCTACLLTSDKARSGVGAHINWLRLLRAISVESVA